MQTKEKHFEKLILKEGQWRFLRTEYFTFKLVKNPSYFKKNWDLNLRQKM